MEPIIAHTEIHSTKKISIIYRKRILCYIKTSNRVEKMYLLLCAKYIVSPRPVHHFSGIFPLHGAAHKKQAHQMIKPQRAASNPNSNSKTIPYIKIYDKLIDSLSCKFELLADHRCTPFSFFGITIKVMCSHY